MEIDGILPCYLAKLMPFGGDDVSARHDVPESFRVCLSSSPVIMAEHRIDAVVSAHEGRANDQFAKLGLAEARSAERVGDSNGRDRGNGFRLAGW